MKKWLSASELAKLPGFTKSASRIRRRAKKEGWAFRRRSGRGGGEEFLIDSIPMPAISSPLLTLKELQKVYEITVVFSRVETDRVPMILILATHLHRSFKQFGSDPFLFPNCAEAHKSIVCSKKNGG
jgi:hypothetical protein